MIKFGANILSQTVQRNLGRATLDLSTASERLSSGQRINKASDDAAGLAIAASLNVNSRVFTQGIRNLNDGLSAVNIAEGAMGELGSIISRIQELAAQSISETYSDKQRQALQKEATALTAEWNRIVESTSFNGQNLLTGASTRTVLQGGKATEGTLAIQIGEEQLAGGLNGYGGTGTILVSRDSLGNQGVGTSRQGAISATGRFVAFESSASNLVSGDTNGRYDAFLKDTITGTTTRVSTDSAGNQSAGDTSVMGISADGRYVLLSSFSNDLVIGDTNADFDVFVKDTATGITTRVSTSSDGTQAAGQSFAAAISADGRYVAFMSNASNLVSNDTNGAWDSFVKDTVTGRTIRVSTSSSGEQAVGIGFSFVSAISADGRYVAFFSDAANLVEGDTNGLRDVFLKDTLTGETRRISTDSSGNQSSGGISEAKAISADGRYVAFWSNATNLIASDTNGMADSFIKDTVTGLTTLISSDSAGNQAAMGGIVTGVSADGRYAIFSSPSSDLVEGDLNGWQDAFIKDTFTGVTSRISTDSAGNEVYGASTEATSISADGRYIAMYSRGSNLVAGDTNGLDDVFIRDLTKTGVQTLAGVVVSNKASAKVTLDLAQRYRAELLDYRSKLGATTSRISTFVNTLQSSTINYTAASSRITDADIAEEAAKSIASGIRQQVASSLLGQANQAPQIGLQLLRSA